jgi:hypothetical protein
VGDTVSLASPLDGITRRDGADIIICDRMRKLIAGFVLREVDRVRVNARTSRSPCTSRGRWQGR